MGDNSGEFPCCVGFGRILRSCICACNIVFIYIPCTVPCKCICGEDCGPPCCSNDGPCDPDGDCCCGSVFA
ncbi:unnamed protein product [Adineta steineri]|uniref:Uncharacterized protein n=1 Tax=Adineta steineri TaxID=433720 RepID=A0A819M343_9BILA|nr:unnamed protein product [Adineta steineri]CAF3973217.1 unnamed protein product [Adineta steineri]